MAKCKVTVKSKDCFQDLQAQYLAATISVVCSMLEEGQEFLFVGENYESINGGKLCMEAYNSINRYIYTAIKEDLLRKVEQKTKK